MRTWTRNLAAGLALLALMSCSQPSARELIVYSGRSQALIEPLVEEFKKETGIDIKVRYGNDAELLAVLNEEGERSPADVVWANTSGALAMASEQGLLAELPDSLLNKPDAFTSSAKNWVPVTVRFRVLAYNPTAVDSASLPASVMNLSQLEKFKGRIGWTPTYSSFYDFITALRLTKGEETARNWLNEMQKLDPKAYGSNPPMIQALAAGEIDIALTNHYYILQMKYGGGEGEYEEEIYFNVPEPDPNMKVNTAHFKPGDLGNLALVTGAGQLKTADNPELAQRFLGYLLSRDAQRYAVETVHEYPVTGGVEMPSYMFPEEKAFRISPDYDYEQLKKLEGTLKLLRETGII